MGSKNLISWRPLWVRLYQIELIRADFIHGNKHKLVSSSCWYEIHTHASSTAASRLSMVGYPLSPHRTKDRRRRMVARRNTLDHLSRRPWLKTESCGVDFAGRSALGRRAAGAGRIATGAVAETNYCYVRQSFRTCTNYRVPYRFRSYGGIIKY